MVDLNSINVLYQRYVDEGGTLPLDELLGTNKDQPEDVLIHILLAHIQILDIDACLYIAERNKPEVLDRLAVTNPEEAEFFRNLKHPWESVPSKCLYSTKGINLELRLEQSLALTNLGIELESHRTKVRDSDVFDTIKALVLQVVKENYILKNLLSQSHDPTAVSKGL
jgi:hypothetical protein